VSARSSPPPAITARFGSFEHHVINNTQVESEEKI